MQERPSKFRVRAYDEHSILPYLFRPVTSVLVLIPIVTWLLARAHALWLFGLVPVGVLVLLVLEVLRFRTIVVGDDGMFLSPWFGSPRFISYETLKFVKVSGRDVIVRVTFDSNLKLRTSSRDKAEHLHHALKKWFVAYNELLFNADDVASQATAYRKAASDVTWKVAFSPIEPISERARAALHLLRDDVTSVNAIRLAEIAGASAHHAFATLVRSRVTGEALTERTKKRIARDLGLHASEL